MENKSRHENEWLGFSWQLTMLVGADAKIYHNGMVINKHGTSFLTAKYFILPLLRRKRRRNAPEIRKTRCRRPCRIGERYDTVEVIGECFCLLARGFGTRFEAEQKQKTATKQSLKLLRSTAAARAVNGVISTKASINTERQTQVHNWSRFSVATTDDGTARSQAVQADNVNYIRIRQNLCSTFEAL
jgi:hypothetical protein